MNRPELVLHGGFHKTATSHIQSLLARNSKMLARSSVDYLHHRDTRKRLTVPVQCNVYTNIGMDWDPQISDAELARMTAAFFDEVLATSAGRVILSALLTDAGREACDQAVLATGVWSKPLMKKLGLDIPLETERGYQLGRYSVLQWVDALRELYALQRELIEARTAIHLNLLELERITGQPLVANVGG